MLNPLRNDKKRGVNDYQITSVASVVSITDLLWNELKNSGKRYLS